MAQRVDVDLLHIAVIVDVLEQRIEFIDRIDAIGLTGLFSAPRLAGRGDKRVVRIGALFDKKEFQLRRHHRIKTIRLEQCQNTLQDGARGEGHDLALMVEGVMDDLRCRLAIPGHQPAAVRIGAQDYIRANLVQNLGIQIGTGHRLAEDIFGKPQTAGISSAAEFVHRQNLAARNAGNVAHQAFHLGDRFLFQPVFHVERHATSPVVTGPLDQRPSCSAVASSAAAAIRTVASISSRV